MQGLIQQLGHLLNALKEDVPRVLRRLIDALVRGKGWRNHGARIRAFIGGFAPFTAVLWIPLKRGKVRRLTLRRGLVIAIAYRQQAAESGRERSRKAQPDDADVRGSSRGRAAKNALHAQETCMGAASWLACACLLVFMLVKSSRH